MSCLLSNVKVSKKMYNTKRKVGDKKYTLDYRKIEGEEGDIER